MSNPFQDKFLQAGLATKKQVGKARIEQNKKEKAKRRNRGKDTVDQTVELAMQRSKDQVG